MTINFLQVISVAAAINTDWTRAVIDFLSGAGRPKSIFSVILCPRFLGWNNFRCLLVFTRLHSVFGSCHSPFHFEIATFHLHSCHRRYPLCAFLADPNKTKKKTHRFVPKTDSAEFLCCGLSHVRFHHSNCFEHCFLRSYLRLHRARFGSFYALLADGHFRKMLQRAPCFFGRICRLASSFVVLFRLSTFPFLSVDQKFVNGAFESLDQRHCRFSLSRV